MKKKHTCKCHKKIGDIMTCDLACLKCGKAKKVITTETNEYKKVEIIF